MANISLTDDQDKANNAFLDFLVGPDNFFVIKGAAGTGKTFLIDHLLHTFFAKYKSYCCLLNQDVHEFDVKVTATTNKAANVIKAFLAGRHPNITPTTIHSLLGLTVKNDRNTGKTTLTFKGGTQYVKPDGRTSLIFIDEASFVPTDLHEMIVNILAEQANAKVVYIGDPYQLAPVGQSFSVMDVVQCEKVLLTQVMRNAGEILHEGHKFRKTVENKIFTPITYGADIERVDGPTFQAMVEKTFSDPNLGSDEAKILAWRNATVQGYNGHLRKHLGRPDIFEAGERVVTNEYIKGNSSFRRSVDSEVTVTRVDPDIVEFHGIYGNMMEIDHSFVSFLPNDFEKVKAFYAKLRKAQNWKTLYECKETWFDLRALYANTVHKAQGSTYGTVYINLTDIGNNWDASDVARLMYVAITRASKKVICYGELPGRYA